MKIYLLAIVVILFVMPNFTAAQIGTKKSDDEKAIRQVVANLENAWAVGDGERFAADFAVDSDFTVWNGFYFNGREANAKNHQQIFDTFYKKTEIKTEIRKIRFLSDEIAVVHLQSAMYKDGKKMEDVPKVVPLMILQKQIGKWKIVVFQNTPIIGEGELVLNRKGKEK